MTQSREIVCAAFLVLLFACCANWPLEIKIATAETKYISPKDYYSVLTSFEFERAEAVHWAFKQLEYETFYNG